MRVFTHQVATQYCLVYGSVFQKCSAVSYNAICKNGHLYITDSVFVEMQELETFFDIGVISGSFNITAANFSYLRGANSGITQSTYHTVGSVVNTFKRSCFIDIDCKNPFSFGSYTLSQITVYFQCYFCNIRATISFLDLYSTVIGITDCDLLHFDIGPIFSYGKNSTCYVSNCWIDSSLNITKYEDTTNTFVDIQEPQNDYPPRYVIEVNMKIDYDDQSIPHIKLHNYEITQPKSYQIAKSCHVDNCLFYNIHHEYIGGALFVNTLNYDVHIFDTLFSNCSADSITMRTTGGAFAILVNNGKVEFSRICGYHCYAQSCHFALIRMSSINIITNEVHHVLFSDNTVLLCSYFSEPEDSSLLFSAVVSFSNNNITKNRAEVSAITFDSYNNSIKMSHFADNFILETEHTEGLLTLDQTIISKCNFVNNCQILVANCTQTSLVECVIKQPIHLMSGVILIDTSYDYKNDSITLIQLNLYQATYLQTPKADKNSLSTGAIIGIVISSTFLLAVVIVIIAYYFVIKKSRYVRQAYELRESIETEFG